MLKRHVCVRQYTRVRGRRLRPAAARPGALRTARADLRPLRAAALVRPGSALAALPRLAHRGRARRPRPRRRDGDGRGRGRARPSDRLHGRRARPERARCSPSRARRVPAGTSSSSRGTPRRCRSRTRSFDGLTFTYLIRYVDDPGATLRELARVVRPGGTVAGLEFCVPPRPRRPRSGGSGSRVGLPLAGRLIAPGWHDVGEFLGPSISGFWRRYPLEALLRLWQEAGIEDVRVPPPQPRRRDRDLWGRCGMSTEARPARRSTRSPRASWRDYVTLLHPPYTLVAPELRRDRRGTRADW